MAKLARQLGLGDATALVISNMIGTGIFATTGFMAGDLGSAKWILLVWLAGGLLSLCGALVYAELGINFPRAGGEYVFLKEAYGPAWGFISGWISFFAGFSAPVAAAALAFGNYVAALFPGVATLGGLGREFQFGWLTLQFGGVQLLAVGLIAFCTLLNGLSIQQVARVQNVLTAIKLLVLVAFVGLALLVGQGNWGNFQLTTERTSAYSLPVQLVISLLWVMVSYSGWNAATYVAEEIRMPERNLPRALALGTSIVTALYVALNVIFLYAALVSELKGVVSVGSLAAVNLFGSSAGKIFAALMAVAIISTVNAMVTIGPRVYYAMAQDRAFLPQAANLHPDRKTPINAIVYQGLCAMLLTLTSFPQLVLYIGFSLTLFTSLAVGAVMLFRRRPGWQRLPALNLTYPVVPLLYLLTGLAMVVYGLIWQPLASGMALLTILAGAAGWRFFLSGKPTASDASAESAP